LPESTPVCSASFEAGIGVSSGSGREAAGADIMLVDSWRAGGHRVKGKSRSVDGQTKLSDQNRLSRTHGDWLLFGRAERVELAGRRVLALKALVVLDARARTGPEDDAGLFRLADGRVGIGGLPEEEDEATGKDDNRKDVAQEGETAGPIGESGRVSLGLRRKAS
jgi:hypothetical protein